MDSGNTVCAVSSSDRSDNCTMKRLLIVAALLMTGCGGYVSFNKTYSYTLQWSTTQTCPSCKFIVYRRDGNCPSALTKTTGWKAIAAVSSMTRSYDDNLPAGVYSYDVESTLDNTIWSGPSNCVTHQVP